MKKIPATFEDRRIYFVITTDDASQEAKKAARSAGWNDDEFYGDWRGFPKNALLVDMGYDLKKKEGEFQGLYRTLDPHKRVTVEYNDGTKAKLTYCPCVGDVLGYKVTKADKKYLASRIRALWEGSARSPKDDDGVVVPFSEARKLLFSEPPVMNVKKKARRT